MRKLVLHYLEKIYVDPSGGTLQLQDNLLIKILVSWGHNLNTYTFAQLVQNKTIWNGFFKKKTTDISFLDFFFFRNQHNGKTINPLPPKKHQRVS